VPYPGHHRERGYNPIELVRVVNGWMRDVTFQDVDNGPIVAESKWMTFENVRFVGRGGHHGINFGRSADNLVTDVHFGAGFVHELTVAHAAHGNVFRQVGGDELVNLDHHGDYPFENLFTHFKSVKTSDVSGGQSPCNTTFYGSPASASSGARSTFWNVTDGMHAPPWIGVQGNLVGKLAGDVHPNKTHDGRWIEDRPRLYPEDLWRAQRAARHKTP
jgi:hypothetical protein